MSLFQVLARGSKVRLLSDIEVQTLTRGAARVVEVVVGVREDLTYVHDGIRTGKMVRVRDGSGTADHDRSRSE